MTRALHVSEHLRLPLEWMTLATVVYGARGSGKTSLGAVLAEEVTAAKQRFCAIDLKGDWYGLKSTADGAGEGIPVVVFGGDHADVPLEDAAGAFIGETVAGMDQSCILDLEHLSKGKQVRLLAAFFEALYDRNREPLLLLLDEAQRYAPQKPIDPDAARCLGATEDLVKLGRKHGIGPVLFTQRGSGLNKEVSELCDLMVAFRTPGPLDQDRIKDWLDANTTKAQREQVMGQLAGLPTGTAVFASGHPDLKIFGAHQVRRRRTFDSSATPAVGQRRLEPKRLATPDLETLRIRMAAAIERQKADDPKELRRRIAELQKHVEDAQRKVVAPPAPKTVKDPQVAALARRLQKAVEQAMKFIVRINAEDFFKAAGESLDQAEVQKAIDQAAQAITKLLERKLDIRNQEIERLKREASRIVGTLKTLLESDVAVDLTVRHNEPFTVSPAPAPRRARAAGRPLPDGTTLVKGEFAVLTAVAQHGDQGVSREQLTILTGYKRSSRDTYLQRLGAQQLVEIIGGGQIFATEAGLAALGPDFEPLPTGDALREHWLQRLTGGEQKILALLIEAHPKALSRDTISEVTDYQRSSRDTYLQRLKARQLVVDEGRGAVKASETLF